MSKDRRRPTEDLARIRINNILTELGWRLDGNNPNVTVGGDTLSPEHKRRLRSKKPDYILYPDNSTTPIGVIEAKKPGVNLARGLEQGAEYARRLGEPDMLIFASDGSVTVARNIHGNSLRINGEVVNSLLSLRQVASLARNPNLDTGRAVKSVDDLIQIFKRASNKLRGAGVEPGLDSLYKFCAILFVRLKSEGGESEWSSMVSLSGNRLLERYRQIIGAYERKYDGLFGDAAGINNARVLQDIVRDIEKINLSETAADVKGGAYEYFLSRYYAGRSSELAQFFTPRHIVDMMVKLLDVKLDEGTKIYDPFCGTGGMLVGFYKDLRNQIPPETGLAKGARDRMETRLRQTTLYGGDISPSASRLAKMNMILLGDGHSNIKQVDSFQNPRNDQYDVVITNIPFNLPARNDGHLYGKSTGDANYIAVLHCLKSLRKGGAAAVIVPETMAYHDGYQEFRNYLRDNCRIRAVISLPRFTFIKYTVARTCCLLIEDMWKGSTRRFPVVVIEDDGLSRDKRRQPVDANDIPALLENKEDLGSYPTLDAGDDDYRLLPEEERTPDAGDSWALGELLEVRRKKVSLEPGGLYVGPRINAAKNSVQPSGDPRPGRNWSGKKIVAREGDLIISTLHTQNGLFAVADREYVVSSQIAARVREDLVEKGYLLFMLRSEIRKLPASRDLVRRETYKEETILGIRIPRPTEELLRRWRRWVELHEQRERIDEELSEIEQSQQN